MKNLFAFLTELVAGVDRDVENPAFNDIPNNLVLKL